MAKRMAVMLLMFFGVVGALAAFKTMDIMAMKKKFASQGMPPVVVSAMPVARQTWQPSVITVGSLRAQQGVDISSEVAGQVREVRVTPGAMVSAGALLIRLNDDADVARLKALQAAAELAKVTYSRDKSQLDLKAVSQATVDADLGDLNAKNAQVAEQQAVLAKKTIRAPFAGRLGLAPISAGQYVNPGDKITTLEAMNPILVDFTVPQQMLSGVKIGGHVHLSADAFPGQSFSARIIALDSKVDPVTRNVGVEAIVENGHNHLMPGMYATVTVENGIATPYLTLPQTAVSFNPYGEIVYVLERKAADAKGKDALVAHQVFVEVGETRGDQVAIKSGLVAGDMVVTAGQQLLKNGSVVVVNNTKAPAMNPHPATPNED